MDAVSDYQNSDHATTRSGCCGRLRAEFALGPFEVVESSGQIIDVQRTFAAKPFWVVAFIKLVLTGICVDVLVRDLVLYNADTRYFYFAYLTHWGLLCGVIFMLLSTINTLMPYPEQPGRGMTPSILVKLTWAFFPLAATIEACIVALYWALDYQGVSVTYMNGMKHGGVFVIVFLDGLFVDRTPVRIHHLRYPMILSILYLIWTVVHGLLTDIGNPNNNGGDQTAEDDDAIYPVLNWEERPESAAVTAFIAVFVLIPLFFMIIYELSLPMRRYVVNDSLGGHSSESTSSTISTRRSLCDVSRFRWNRKQSAKMVEV